jgi:UDPglucose 6-dehydrogenase
MSAVVASNGTRMGFVASQVMARQPRIVGVYRLVMKAGSDNFRESATLAVAARLREAGARVIVHEPLADGLEYDGLEVVPDLAEFKRRADVILANRWSEDLADVADKVYTRDLYRRD